MILFILKKINNPKISGDSDIYCTIQDTSITGFIPTDSVSVTLDSLIPTFITKGKNVVIHTLNVVSDSSYANFNTTEIVCTVTAEDGSFKNYYIRLSKFTGLPILYINTDDGGPVVSEDDYKDGSYRLIANGNSFESDSGDLQIKGHGNSTWGMPKKPYNIKLEDKASLLGLPKLKKWVLLANYSDKTLLRNYLSYNFFGTLFNAAYTPKADFVELVFNGKYVGNYLLSQKIQISNDVVNIADVTDGGNNTGGYLMEIDHHTDNDDYGFTSTINKQPIYVKDPDPEDLTDDDKIYLKSYIDSMETAFVKNDGSWKKYIDASSFINWFWVNEIMRNEDAAAFSSLWFFKERDSSIKMGPIWDFDLSGGNGNYNTWMLTDGFYFPTHCIWLKYLLQDSSFNQSVIAVWKEKKSQLSDYKNFLEQKALQLSYSEKQNFNVWRILDIAVWPNPEVAGSYEGEIIYLENWLDNRISWIDNNLDKL